jgi:CRISPR-associated protein Cas10/Cmr2 subtype III-B
MLLATWDTDKIKDYVFATSRLREIRGASALLDELNDDEVARIVGNSVGMDGIIYAGGGTALALLDSEAQFHQVTQEIERKYRKETRTAEITAASIEVVEEDLDKTFGELVRVLNHKLRAVKESKISPRNCISSPILKVCESCGQQPASAYNLNDFICHSCEAKRNRSKAIRDPDSDRPSRLGDLLRTRKAQERWPGANTINAPEDFNEIGDVSRPRGYIGFIYCDGNRMGDLMRRLQKRAAFKSFSEDLRKAMVDIVSDSLLESFGEMRRLPDKPDTAVLPFEIIFIGGDDLMLIVAADKAVEIACDLCTQFEEESAGVLNGAQVSHERERLSMSAGVVLAHASLPIYHLQAVADDLLKSAKRRSVDLLRSGKGEMSCILPSCNRLRERVADADEKD